MRGLGVAAFFAIVLTVMIPAYVPRPAFIPGFAPPPDMWPRTVCIIGIVLGLILALMAWLSRVARVVPDPEKQAAGDAGPALLLGRFALAVVALGLGAGDYRGAAGGPGVLLSCGARHAISTGTDPVPPGPVRR